jgi:hypothetical protein
MRKVLALAALLLTAGCAQGMSIDWARTGSSALEGVCRQSSRCDVPACDQGPGPRQGACDNPYAGQDGRRTRPAGA